MARIKKAQFGLRMMSPLKDKSPAGKNVRRFQKNPFTGATMIKEKDVEYKTKGSPRRVYKSTSVSTPKGEKETRVMKEKGKVVKRFESQKNGGSTPAWQRKEGKNPSGGLNAKGVASYRAANPGSKLKTAVTTKPSKLKAGSKAANRRKSFCARMSGMKKRLTSAKTANDPNSRINKSLRKWNC
jgi:hypothetical protein